MPPRKAEPASLPPDALVPDPSPTGVHSARDGIHPAGKTANALIEIGARFQLFHDERRDGYVLVGENDIRRTLRLRGREFRQWLNKVYHDETGNAAGGHALSAALEVLDAKAIFDNPVIPLANRFLAQDGAVFIDLCDARWRVVRVTAAGWEILDRPRPLFRRYCHQQPLPEPERGGTLGELRRFVNLRDVDEQHLVEAWLATAVFANIPRPALMLHGPQGAAKTTLARALKSLLDPSVTDTIDLGRDPGALAQVLDHNAIPCFDNLTGMPAWAGDLLCKGVTGGGYSKRELYSDAEDILFDFRRAIILTGINIPTQAPDLLDRLLLVELDRIPPQARRDERSFWREFEAARPRLFGALLDAVAGILRYRDRITLKGLPRMADFAALACAYAEHAGIGTDRMMQVIMENAGRQIQEVVESDPLATAVRDFTERQRRWEGTATDLLSTLNQAFQIGIREGWPKSAKSLGRRLKILHSTLSDIGIDVTWDSSTDKTKRLIRLAVGHANQTSETSASSRPGLGAASRPDVSQNPAPTNVRETSDLDPDQIKDLDVSDVSDKSFGTFPKGDGTDKIEVTV